MRDQCDICLGSGVVRLTVYRPVNFSADIIPDVAEESRRVYACPACGGDEPIERVHVVEHHTEFTLPFGSVPADVFNGAIKSAVCGLAALLLDRGFIRVREFPSNGRFFDRKHYVATVAVASRTDAVKIEERIKSDREVFGKAVVEEAIRWINNWGSYFRHTSISKATAAESVRNGLDSAKRRFELKDTQP